MTSFLGATLLAVLVAGPTEQAREVMKKTEQSLGSRVTVWPIGFANNGIVAYVARGYGEMCEEGPPIVLSVFDLRSDKELERIDATFLVTGEPFPETGHAELTEVAGTRRFHTSCEVFTRDPRKPFDSHFQKIVAKYGLTVRGTSPLETKYDDDQRTFSFAHNGHSYTVATIGVVCKDADLSNLEVPCQRVDGEHGDDLEYSPDDVVTDLVLWRDGKGGKVIARGSDGLPGRTSQRIAGVWLSPVEQRVAIIQVRGTRFESALSSETVGLIGAHLTSGFAKPTYRRRGYSRP